MKHPLLKRILAFVLVFAMIAAYVPELAFGTGTVLAETGSSAVSLDKTADSSTMDDWTKLFGSSVDSTEYAGAVKFDKSVFTGVSDYMNKEGVLNTYGAQAQNAANVIKLEDDSFLVALSAIASSKSIVGYSHIPTDTMLVLDVSGSMNRRKNNNDAVEELVDATNLAITELLKVNKHNRVGVVLYSGNHFVGSSSLGNATLLLPLDRYTAGDTDTITVGHDNITVGKYITFGADKNAPDKDDLCDYVQLNRNVKDSSGSSVSVTGTKKHVVGGTYIQAGMERAKDEFLSADTIIGANEFQAGTTRIPVFVLMSDGAPTAATSSYMDVKGSQYGDGTATNNEIAFLSQLTAAYAKSEVDKHYEETTPLFYTMGFKVNQSEAHYVLDPEANTDNKNGINQYWNTYLGKNSVTVGGNAVQSDSGTRNNRYYVDRYFPAEDNAALINTFKNIVDQIILQSLYRPTFVSGNEDHLDGYIDIVDDIGGYMEVKDIEGIVWGTTLFSGAEFTHGFIDGAFGTTQNPTALGDNFIRSLVKRLDLENIKVKDADGNDTSRNKFPTNTSRVQEARSLLSQAYADGQLYHNAADHTDYSNYIGWYADANGKYMAFWDKDDDAADVPAGAKYVVKSYGMLGEIGGEYDKSDMMYISIRVVNEIDFTKSAASGQIEKGAQQLIWKIPASLIPIVKYEVSITEKGSYPIKNLEDVSEYFSDNTSENDPAVSVSVSDDEPIRLLAEVGMKDEINPVNVSELVKDAYTMNADGSVIINNDSDAVSAAKDADGNYYFYTNKWNSKLLNKENSFPQSEINTVGVFQPSKENERYYFPEITKVFVKGANGTFVPYTGSAKPESGRGTYYHPHYIFEEVNGAYRLTVSYHPTNLNADHADPLKNVYRGEDGFWYIPKGTPHHTEMFPELYRSTNETNTVGYAAYPKMEYHEATASHAEYYYFDAILGNNGRIGMTPATGIVLEKAIDHTISDANREYTFTVNGANLADGEYDVTFLKVSADGRESGDGDLLEVTGGTAVIENLTLKAGDKLYILGIPSGDYTVTENIPTGAKYQVGAVSVDGTAVSPVNNGTTVEVKDQNLTNVAFTNVFKGISSLFISKEVEHPFGADYTVPADLTFPVTVTLTAAAGTALPDTAEVYQGSELKETVAIGADGTFIVNVPADSTVRVELNIASDQISYEVSLSEENIRPGFTNKEIVFENGIHTITAAQNVIADVVNTYDPTGVKLETAAQIVGTKTIRGRPWIDGDKFDFVLQQYLNSGWENVNGGASVTHTGENLAGSTAKSFSLTEALASLSPFETTGTFAFRVIEVENNEKGITSDSAAYLFFVTIGDPDMDGDLDITDVFTSSADGFITAEDKNGDGRDDFWTVRTEFINEYAATGSVGITLTVDKTVTEITDSDSTANSGAYYTPAGFSFDLYLVAVNGNAVEASKVTETVTTELKPNADGTGYDESTGFASFGTLEFTANDVGKTYTYEIREVETGVDGMIEAAPKTLTIRITDNYDGTLGAVVTVDGEEISGSGTLAYGADIENIFVTEPLELDLSGTKFINGGSYDKAFGSFSFNITGSGVNETVSVSEDGTFAFSTLVFEKVGSYEYVIKELDGTNPGITYDKSQYKLTVSVEADGDKGQIKETHTLVKTHGADGALLDTPVKAELNGITFDNTYSAAAFEGIELTGTKTVNNGGGKDFGTFQFKVTGHETLSVQTADRIVFGLSAITEPGVYTYEVSEAPASAPIAGMFYDGSIYKVVITVTDEDANGNKTGALAIASAAVTKTHGTNGSAIENPQTVTYTAADLANGTLSGFDFINEYAPTDAEVPVEGEKAIIGSALEADAFTFILSGGHLAQDLEITNTAGGTFDFGTFTFGLDDLGTYTYTVKEKIGSDDTALNAYGMTYDKSVYQIVVEITDNDLTDGEIEKNVTIKKTVDRDGNAIAEEDQVAVNAITFVNDYKVNPASTSLTLSINKEVENYNTTDLSGFVFQLNGVDKATTDESGSAAIVLGPFTSTGTHTFVLTEKPGTHDRMDFDKSEYTITVTVTDDDLYDGALNTSVSILKTKNADGSAANESLNTLEFDYVNRYKPVPAGVTVDLSIEKELEYNDDTELGVDGWEFVLVDENGSILTNGFTDAAGKATITLPYEYREEDIGSSFTYFLKEVDTEIDRIVYDGSVYKITVTVADNDVFDNMLDVTATVLRTHDENGEPVANAAESTDLTFKYVNTYLREPDPLDFTFNIQKAVKIIGETDVEIPLSGWEFVFKTADGEQLLITDENGVISFGDVVTEDSVQDVPYVFYLYETLGNSDRVTYDQTVYKISLLVTDIDKEDGKLETAVSVMKIVDKDGNLIENPVPETIDPAATDLFFDFENVYTAKPDDITVDFIVNKTVKNLAEIEIGPEGFEFAFEDVDQGEGTVLTTDKDGYASITKTYTEDDIGKVFNYRIFEFAGDMENMEYCDSVYDVSVEIILTENNELIAVIDGESTTEYNTFFENIYEEKVPDTGDSSDLAIWLVLLLTSGAALTYFTASKKRA